MKLEEITIRKASVRITIRAALALTIGMIATTLATHAVEPNDVLAAAGCPGLVANITLQDYDGTHLLQLCVAPGGFSINAGVVTLSVYDNQSDGIFHNSFE
ncbi:MAG: hypothetical protein ABIQ70_05715 [Dokdonella sp.]